MPRLLPGKLRMVRVERGYGLREAARMTGVRPETLSELERGLRTPHPSTLHKIAQGYGIPVRELLEEPVLLGKTGAPSTPPSTVAELLDAAGVADRDLEKPKEEINALFKSSSSYKETLDLARRIINARRAVYALISSYREDPNTTPQEKGALDRLDVHTMLINSIAIFSAHEAAEAEAARAREEGDIAHAEEIERDKERSLVAGGV